MELKLRRGQGVFILHSVLLPADDVVNYNGVIDFTHRPLEQQLMLTKYTPTASNFDDSDVTGVVIFSGNAIY